MTNTFLRRFYSLDNEVRASGFSKELEERFEQVKFYLLDLFSELMGGPE